MNNQDKAKERMAKIGQKILNGTWRERFDDFTEWRKFEQQEKANVVSAESKPEP